MARKVTAIIKQMSATPEWNAAITQRGGIPTLNTSKDNAKFIKEQAELYENLLREQLSTVGRATVDSFDLDLLRSIEAVRAAGLVISSQHHLESAKFE